MRDALARRAYGFVVRPRSFVRALCWLALVASASASCNGARGPAGRDGADGLGGVPPRDEPAAPAPPAIPRPAHTRADAAAGVPDAAAEPVDPFAKFRAAARAVRAGEAGRLVRVAHLGDSHTASEALTGKLRQILQRELGDGGHGFVVPAWADARLHRGVLLRDGGGWTVDRVRYQPEVDAGDRLFGIGAVSVRGSVAGTWAQVTGRGSSFDVYYLEAPGGGSFVVRIDGGRPERVATAASEPRAGFVRVEAPDGRHVVEIRLVGDGEVRLFGVEIEHPGPGLVYASLGVTGARASTPLEWDGGLFRSQLTRLSPDLVVLMYGTNDLFANNYSVDSFATSIATLLARLRSGAPAGSCLVLAPPDVARRGAGRALESVPELVEMVRRAREGAGQAGCAFWDTFAAMGGAGSIVSWGAARPPLAAPDHVHLSRAGYERLAEQLAEEVLLPATR